jgi:hypothetical protein
MRVKKSARKKIGKSARRSRKSRMQPERGGKAEKQRAEWELVEWS